MADMAWEQFGDLLDHGPVACRCGSGLPADRMQPHDHTEGHAVLVCRSCGTWPFAVWAIDRWLIEAPQAALSLLWGRKAPTDDFDAAPRCVIDELLAADGDLARVRAAIERPDQSLAAADELWPLVSTSTVVLKVVCRRTGEDLTDALERLDEGRLFQHMDLEPATWFDVDPRRIVDGLTAFEQARTSLHLLRHLSDPSAPELGPPVAALDAALASGRMEVIEMSARELERSVKATRIRLSKALAPCGWYHRYDDVVKGLLAHGRGLPRQLLRLGHPDRVIGEVARLRLIATTHDLHGPIDPPIDLGRVDLLSAIAAVCGIDADIAERAAQLVDAPDHAARGLRAILEDLATS